MCEIVEVEAQVGCLSQQLSRLPLLDLDASEVLLYLLRHPEEETEQGGKQKPSLPQKGKPS